MSQNSDFETQLRDALAEAARMQHAANERATALKLAADADGGVNLEDVLTLAQATGEHAQALMKLQWVLLSLSQELA